jgi:hypothetical protein
MRETAWRTDEPGPICQRAYLSGSAGGAGGSGAVVQQVADEGDAGLDSPLAGVAETEEQSRRVEDMVGAVGARPVQPGRA